MNVMEVAFELWGTPSSVTVQRTELPSPVSENTTGYVAAIVKAIDWLTAAPLTVMGPDDGVAE